MRFEGPLVPATFRARPNRFLGVVEVNGKTIQCYIPNPGRMGELLYPGARTYLLERKSENRKTLYDLVLVDLGGTLVSIDSRVPNKVVADAIESDQIPEFIGLHIEKREYTLGDSRLDFLLRGGWGQLLLEVKSCTLVRDGTGLFPDAPTARGSKHLRSLVGGLALGRAAAFFLIQRHDARRLRPNDAADPEFGKNLREAARRGVEVYAYSSKVTFEGVFINERVQVLLGS